MASTSAAVPAAMVVDGRFASCWAKELPASEPAAKGTSPISFSQGPPPPGPAGSFLDQKSVMRRLRCCFQAATSASPEISGGLVLALEVLRDGTVAAVTPYDSSFEPALVGCLVEVARRARFAADARRDERVTVRIPLRLMVQR
jgi:outer membrane biosynthesis protein TonB